MFFNETFSVAAFNICKEEVNWNRKRNLQVHFKNFSRFGQRQGVSHSPTSFLNSCIERKMKQYTCISYFIFDQ